MAWNRTVHYTLDRDVSENFDDDVNKATKESISFFETGDNSGSAFFVGQLGVTDATSYIELPVGGTASFEDQEFSFSMWIKPTLLNHGAETYKWLVTKHNTGAGWHLKMDLDGVLTFQEYGGSSNDPIRETITTETLTIDSWNHLAVVVQQDRVTIYVNGTAETNFTARSEDIDYTNTVAYIGRRVGSNQHALGGNSFRGYIDDFHYYDDTWGSSDVSSMFLSGRPDNYSPVELAYFPLDADAQDSVGDNHATTNDITFSDGTAEFDGTLGADLDDTSYVEIGNPSNFHLQSYSVSFWYNPTSTTLSAGRGKRWLVSVLGNAGGSSIGGWSLYFVSNRQLTYQEHSGGGGFRQCIPSGNAAKAKLNTWKHVALSVSGWFIRIYVNGNLVKQTMTPRSWLINWGTATAWLGRVYDNMGAGGAGDAFAGYMDDVKFYSGTLNSDDVTTLYNAGRPVYTPPASSSSTPTGKIFTSVLGRPDGIVKPNPHLGWVAANSAGQSFESTDGAAGTWSSPATIPGGGHNRNVSPIVSEGGFWFAIVGGDSSFFQQQNHLAYANALDGSSSSVFPSTNGWVQITDDGSSVDKPRALYGDGVYAYNTQVNDDSMTGSWQNRLYRSNIAADSTSTPVWTQLNANASWNGQSVTGSMTDTDGNSVSNALSIYHGAANGTLHVWVCKDQNDPTEFKACKIVTYDMAAGTDVIQATFANKPNAAVCLRIPVYCSASSAWFVPCRDGVLKSTDGGLNWSLISISYSSFPAADHVYVNALAASESGTLVAVGYTTTSGYEAGIIYRSVDAGATWTAIATHEENLYSVAAATDGNWVVGGTNNTLGLSVDDGQSWANASDAEDNGSAGATVSALHYGGLE